jgi:signal transduction histidine kinase
MSRSLRVRVALVGVVSCLVGVVAYASIGVYVVDNWWALLARMGVRFAIIAAAVLGGAVVFVVLLRFAAGWVLRPLTGVADTVRQLGPQNMGQRIRHGGPHDELRTLTDALDEMLDRVATGYEGQRRFASNASHELRTPLAVQRTLVEVAMVTGEQDLSRLAAQLLVVNERNERLIEGLLVLAESDRGLPGTASVRLDVLAGEVLDRFAAQAAEHELTIRRDLAERTVPGEAVLLDRLVSNLVSNAIKYNEPGGSVDVTIADRPALTVRNTGQRVPAEAVPALFEPFRRLTAERTHQRDGAGLGLSIVRSIVAAHDGTVSASAGERGGLTVTVHLPEASRT